MGNTESARGLNVDATVIDCVGKSVDARLLVKFLSHNRVAKCLYMSWCSLGDPGARMISRILRTNSCLRVLRLLIIFLQKNTRNRALVLLVKVVLAHNSSTPFPVTQRHTQVMDLSSNNITDGAVVDMARAIGSNPQLALEELSLENNFITDVGAQHLV